MSIGHWSTHNDTVAPLDGPMSSRPNGPDPLGISGGEKVVDYLQERRRLRAAGFCHIDRLSVDGGPVTEPKPIIRRRLLLNAAAMVGVFAFALGLVVALLGVL